MVKFKLFIIFLLIAANHLCVSLLVDLHMEREYVIKVTALSSEAVSRAIQSSFTPESKAMQEQLMAEMSIRMKRDKQEIIEAWIPYSYFITFPTGSVMAEFWEDLRHLWISLPAKNKEISEHQRISRANFLIYLERSTNSLAFALLIYLIVFFVVYIRRIYITSVTII
jgi:hypothetical protein